MGKFWNVVLGLFKKGSRLQAVRGIKEIWDDNAV
jgi:hypothetical protein